METNGKNRFASQGVSIAQMMYVSKYNSHKIALFNSMKKSNIAPISSYLCRKERYHSTVQCSRISCDWLRNPAACSRRYTYTPLRRWKWCWMGQPGNCATMDEDCHNLQLWRKSECKKTTSKWRSNLASIENACARALKAYRYKTQKKNNALESKALSFVSTFVTLV